MTSVGTSPGIPPGARVAGPEARSATLAYHGSAARRRRQRAPRLATEVATPGSARFRHFLRPRGIQARFGPPPAAAAAVRSWLRGQHLTIRPTLGDGLLLPAAGTVGRIEAAFRTTIDRVRLADGRTALVEPAAPGSASIPASLGVRRHRPQQPAPAPAPTWPPARFPAPEPAARPAPPGTCTPRPGSLTPTVFQPAVPPARLRAAHHRGSVRAGRLRQPRHPGVQPLLPGASGRAPGAGGRRHQRRGVRERHSGSYRGHRGHRGHGAAGENPRLRGAPVGRGAVPGRRLRGHRPAEPRPGREQLLGWLRAADRGSHRPPRGATVPGDGPAGPVDDGGHRGLRLGELPERGE